jgi:hypothetical protein
MDRFELLHRCSFRAASLVVAFAVSFLIPVTQEELLGSLLLDNEVEQFCAP